MRRISDRIYYSGVSATSAFFERKTNTLLVRRKLNKYKSTIHMTPNKIDYDFHMNEGSVFWKRTS